MNAKMPETGLTNQNYIDYLVDDFNRDLIKLNAAYDAVSQLNLGLDYNRYLNIDTKAILSKEISLNILKADYWQKVFTRSNIEHFLSANVLSEIKDSFIIDRIVKDNIQHPDFDKVNVKATIENWFNGLEGFFIDRVDAVFSTLSHGHLTNHPNGFNRKMVFKYWLDTIFSDKNYASLRYESRDKLHDLRCIIQVSHGLPTPARNTDLFRKLSYGERIQFDDGLWELQAFKNGNVHVWVDPETAVQLNWYLSQKYPNAIGGRDVAETKNKKKFNYQHDSISNDLRMVLDDLKEGSLVVKNADFDKYFGLSKLDLELAEQDQILAFTDQVKNNGLPNIKSYQFYPSPTEITTAIYEYIGDDPEGKFLEPSAGNGAIAGLYPTNFTAFEIYKPFLDILKIKGVENVQNIDFLQATASYDFDKVVMNPPYSFNRCLTHFEHAFKFIHSEGEVLIVAPTGLEEKLKGIAGKYGRDLTVIKNFSSCFMDTKIKTSLYVAS